MLTLDWRLGVNMREFIYYGTNILAPDPANTQGLQDIQLAALQKINNQLVRIFVPNEKFTITDTINRTRTALRKVQKAGMQAILCMDDSVRISGFYIPEHNGFKNSKYDFPWELGHYDYKYFNDEMYKDHYIPYLEKVVEAFKGDPAIFAWELGNELALHPQQHDLDKRPDVGGRPPTSKEFLGFYNFAKFSSETIKNISPNHLVSTGLVSIRHVVSFDKGFPAAMEQGRKLYALPTLDLISIHFYAEDGDVEEKERVEWDVHVAQAVQKPFYVGELGASPGRVEINRVKYHREKMRKWKDLGAFSVMPWQFNALSNDMRISDGFSGMHGDFHAIKEEVAKFGSHAKPFVQTGEIPPSGQVAKGEAKSVAASDALIVTDEGLPIFAEPNQNMPELASEIPLDAVIKPVGQKEVDGRIWWRIEGWVEQDDDTSPLIDPDEQVQESLTFRVLFGKGLNIRSSPEVKISNKAGDAEFNQKLECFTHTAKADDHIWRQIITTDGSTQWIAETEDKAGIQPYLRQISDGINRKISVEQIKIVSDHVILYAECNTDSDRLSTPLAMNTILDVEHDAKVEEHGKIWWKISAWVPGHMADDALDDPNNILQPYDPSKYTQFRVAQFDQRIYQSTKANPKNALTSGLSLDSIVTVEADSRKVENGIVWWKITGWVQERAVGQQTNSDDVTLRRVIAPKKKLAYQVVTDFVNVRTAPSVGNNLVAKAYQGDVLHIYEDSLTIEMNADGKPDMNGYTWWKHDDGVSIKTGQKVPNLWTAEFSNDKEVRFLKRRPEFDEAPPMRLQVASSRLALRNRPGQHGTTIGNVTLRENTLLTVENDKPLEKDGALWWKVVGWIPERAASVSEGDPAAFLHPLDVTEVEKFRVIDANQEIFAAPNLVSTTIGTDLSAGLIINVDPKSRVKRDGFIWWQVKGWVRSQSIETEQNAVGVHVPVEVFMQEQEAKPNPNALKKFRVVHTGGVNVRSDSRINARDIGDLVYNDEVMVEPKTVTNDGYVWRKHEIGWSAEFKQGGTTFLEEVEEEPPTRMFIVTADDEKIYAGAGITGVPLAENLTKGSKLIVDNKTKRHADGYVWWEVAAWIKERPDTISPRESGVFLYPQPPEDISQYVVTDRNTSGLFADAQKNADELSFGLKSGAIVDILNGSRTTEDGFVWWEANGWVMETNAGSDKPLLTKATNPLGEEPDKAFFKVTLRGGIWVRSEPRISSQTLIGELFEGDLIETTVTDTFIDSSGMVWWKHSNGRDRKNPNVLVGEGWSAEVDARGRRFMERLETEVVFEEYLVNTDTLPVFSWPDEDSPRVAPTLHRNAKIMVDPVAKVMREGITWRKFKAWLIERPSSIPTAAEGSFLLPTGSLEKVYLEIISKGDLWVRNFPRVPTNRMDNVVGEIWTGDVVEAYADSRVERDGYVWWRHDDGRHRTDDDQEIIDGWSAEYEVGDKENPLMRHLDIKDVQFAGVEEVYQNPQETVIDVNNLPQRDRLFDRLPVDMTKNQIIQHYGSTIEAFKFKTYVKAFQGLHPGIDLGPAKNISLRPEVYAGVHGKVEQVYDHRFYQPYGIRVKVGPYSIIYGHLQQPPGGIQWVVGAEITPDTVVGRIANNSDLAASGIRFTPHLHWEIRYTKVRPNRVLNPLLFLPRNLRQQLVRMKPIFNISNHFKTSAKYPDWDSVMEQPVIKLAGPLMGPLDG